jgi:hypothetical protein
MMMQIEAEERQTDVGILTKFVQTVDDIPHISVSSLHINKRETPPPPKSPQPFILLDDNLT